MRFLSVVAAAAAPVLLPEVAQAATTGMPWETPLDTVQQSLTGPVVTAIAAIAVALSGVLFALAPEGGFARRVAGIGLGLSIAVAAPSFVGTLFGTAAGAEFSSVVESSVDDTIERKIGV
ncbi:MAG: TrbC/VirB2 family protein [Geminicoccaceae bacterium]